MRRHGRSATSYGCPVTPATAQLRVPSHAASVGTARRFAMAAAAELGGDDAAQDVVRSLVSELVTNVVLHVGSDTLVRVLDDADTIRVEVVDASPVLPRQRRVNGESTTGRGLRLLQALSLASGFAPDDGLDEVGKRVWFQVARSTTPAQQQAGELAAFDLFRVELEELAEQSPRGGPGLEESA